MLYKGQDSESRANCVGPLAVSPNAHDSGLVSYIVPPGFILGLQNRHYNREK